MTRAWQSAGCAFVVWLCIVGVTTGQAVRSEIADAAQRGDRAAVQKLIQAKTDVNAPQVDGATALMWAVYREDAELVDVLIRAGADVKAANRAGVTALMMASMYGNAPVMDRLRQSKDNEERAYMAQALGELLAIEQPTTLNRLIAGSNFTVRNDNLLPLQRLANGFLFDFLIPNLGEQW